MRCITRLAAHAQITHPEIRCPISQLSRIMRKPCRKHVDDAHRVIQYLYNTRGEGVTFHQGLWTAPCGTVYPSIVPLVYVDSNFAGSGLDAYYRSHTDIIIMMNRAMICAKSFFQKITADSFCYAETVALHSAVKRAMGARNLFE